MSRIVAFYLSLVVLLGTVGCQPQATQYRYRAGTQYEYQRLMDAWIPNNGTLAPLPPLLGSTEGDWVPATSSGEVVRPSRDYGYRNDPYGYYDDFYRYSGDTRVSVFLASPGPGRWYNSHNRHYGYSGFSFGLYYGLDDYRRGRYWHDDWPYGRHRWPYHSIYDRSCFGW